MKRTKHGPRNPMKRAAPWGKIVMEFQEGAPNPSLAFLEKLQAAYGLLAEGHAEYGLIGVRHEDRRAGVVLTVACPNCQFVSAELERDPAPARSSDKIH